MSSTSAVGSSPQRRRASLHGTAALGVSALSIDAGGSDAASPINAGQTDDARQTASRRALPAAIGGAPSVTAEPLVATASPLSAEASGEALVQTAATPSAKATSTHGERSWSWGSREESVEPSATDRDGVDPSVVESTLRPSAPKLRSSLSATPRLVSLSSGHRRHTPSSSPLASTSASETRAALSSPWLTSPAFVPEATALPPVSRAHPPLTASSSSLSSSVESREAIVAYAATVIAALRRRLSSSASSSASSRRRSDGTTASASTTPTAAGLNRPKDCV